MYIIYIRLNAYKTKYIQLLTYNYRYKLFASIFINIDDMYIIFILIYRIHII